MSQAVDQRAQPIETQPHFFCNQPARADDVIKEVSILLKG